MKKSKKTISKSIKQRWIYTYLLVLFVPLIISLLVFDSNIHFIEKQMKTEGETVLRWGSSELGAWQQSCYTILDKVIDNNDIYRIINSFDNNYDKTIIKGYLELYRKYSDSVKSVSILVPDQNWVASSETYSNIYLNYLIYKNDGYQGDYDSWKRLFQSYYKGDFIVLPMSSSNELLYMTSINYSEGEKYFNLIVSLNSQFVGHTINSFLPSENAEFFIIENDKIVFSFSPGSKTGEILKSDYNDLYTFIDGSEYVFFKSNDLFENLELCYIVPKKEYLSNVNKQITGVVISITFCVVFGIFLIALFVKKNYSPISSIINELPVKSSILKDEYAYIYDSVKDIVSKNKNMQSQLKKQNDLVRNNILVKLVKQGVTNVIPQGKMLEDYGIYFIGERYATIMFYLEDVSKLFIEENISEHEQIELSVVIIDNIVSELAQKYGVGYMLDIDNALVFLMNFEDCKEESTILSELRQLCEQAKSAIYANFDIRFTVSISSVHTGYSEMKLCLVDCITAMEYRLIKGLDSIIEYAEVSDNDSFEYQYSIKDEQRLINSILAGDYEQSQKIAEAVINKNIDDVNSIKCIKLLVFDIMGTMYKAIDEMHITEQRSQLRLIVENIIDCTTMEEIRDEINDILSVLCNGANDIKDSAQNIIVRHVIEYIDANYQDISLSVAMLAENNGITPNYLSKIFKDVTGERLLYYIHNIRLNKAKEILLNERSLTVEQIANRVGYSNTATFNRTFLKFEGVSPTKWLERNSRAED
ncbi:MAG: helix-turn-helix transcriptional regulator [Clostridia bacterium]|nr:helix-turn-helix transcriptional regulator [Clostridia bacterium]